MGVDSTEVGRGFSGGREMVNSKSEEVENENKWSFFQLFNQVDDVSFTG